MTKYELMRWVTYPTMPVILITVRKDLKRLIKQFKKSKSYAILDVGGRKSPYTTNLKAEITLLDVPQENETQEKLNLGFTNNLLRTLKKTRSNIKDVIIQDMTKSKIPNESYDAVVCVEVIEHVEEDAVFVQNISNVIKPGGWAYFTTPNGDYIKNETPNFNPDHKRHYTKQQLQVVLERHFKEVEIKYAVKTGKFRVWGLKSFSIKKPIRLCKSILGNVINRIESNDVSQSAHGTAHLIATCSK